MHTVFKVNNKDIQIKLFNVIYKVVFCYRITRCDEWEIFPSEVTMDVNIGSGAFGTFFCGLISRDTCKNMPYFKLHYEKLGRKGEINRVAVKYLKGK